MSTLKKLAGAAALYGLSSILARLLNFLLTPLHTTVLSKSEYGAYSDLYVFIAFLMVVLTYGFETAYFRFSQKEGTNAETVYSTAMWSVLGTTALFLLLLGAFYQPIAEVLRYGSRPALIVGTGCIVAMDVLAAIPFARLRAQGKAKKFVAIKTGLIVVNIALNFLFYYFMPRWDASFDASGIEWVLVANLGASAFMLLALWSEWAAIRPVFDKKLWQNMLLFGAPLLLAGLPGVANEMADRFFIKYLLPAETSLAEVGTYSAIYKLSIFLVLFNQAFRYAAEPFFFKAEGEGNARPLLARVTRVFVGMVGLGMVCVLAGVDLIKNFIAEKYWDSLALLPVLLMANLLLALNTQMSLAYKLVDKTHMALVITLIGFVLTVVLNVLWIPEYGITGAAWATLVSYFSMTVASYVLSERYYAMGYDTLGIALYLLAAGALGYFAFASSGHWGMQLLSVVAFAGLFFWKERPDRWRNKTAV